MPAETRAYGAFRAHDFDIAVNGATHCWVTVAQVSHRSSSPVDEDGVRAFVADRSRVDSKKVAVVKYDTGVFVEWKSDFNAEHDSSVPVYLFLLGTGTSLTFARFFPPKVQRP